MAERRPRQALDARLAEHRAALAQCRRCHDAGSELRPILSLARAPRVLLVGQAPGSTEVTSQRPFAGRAGRTLFRWLESAGVGEEMARQRIYIAAITRCYPGPSPSGRGDRVPSPTECARCGSWLDDELRMIRPRLIIPVGKLAIEHFLGPSALADVIGRRHQVTHVGGASAAIPLPHPSGASSWIHHGNHPALLDRALDLLRAELETLIPRRSVA